MRIKYPLAIKESEDELVGLEHRLRGQKTADRVRMLRLLKSGAVSSLKDCAPVVGYSLIQVTRWWESYRSVGLAGLLKRHKSQGQASRLTAEAWAGLLGEMRVGRIATLEDARTYLEKQWGIRYKSGKSVWDVFKRKRVKWKTGRRRHKQAHAGQQQAFKKTSGRR
jgi:transposase